MRECPQCGAKNANRHAFCGMCGGLIQIDPAFVTKVRSVLAQERKRNRAKYVAWTLAAITVFAWVESEIGIRMIATAVQSALHSGEAKIESDVQRDLQNQLPRITSQASTEMSQAIEKALRAEEKSHQRR